MDVLGHFILCSTHTSSYFLIKGNRAAQAWFALHKSMLIFLIVTFSFQTHFGKRVARRYIPWHIGWLAGLAWVLFLTFLPEYHHDDGVTSAFLQSSGTSPRSQWCVINDRQQPHYHIGWQFQHLWVNSIWPHKLKYIQLLWEVPK